MSFPSYFESDKNSTYDDEKERNKRNRSKLQPPDWDKIELVEFRKNFYQERKSIARRSWREIKRFRIRYEMVVTGRNILNPITTFKDAMFPDYLLHEIKKAGFRKPTPIQCQGWPMTLSGRDCIGIAKTGSGKTLTFILPAIVHINAQPLLLPGDGPIALILTPIRELATQILAECHKFGQTSRIKYTCIVGGIEKHGQIRDLKEGVEIVIGTPGRLVDFLEKKFTNLKRVTYLVLDEADRMLEMGFERHIRCICRMIRPDRQMLLWSATWPKEVEVLARDFTKNAIQITIGKVGSLNINKDIKQVINIVQERDKKNKLCDVLEKVTDGSKVLIFCETKRACDALCNALQKDGWPIQAMHGDKDQQERDRAMDEFRSGKTPMLIATDLASRGIDVKGIGFVINFDFPGTLEEYVHRCGRTARAGKKGTAISFFTAQDRKKAPGLIQILRDSGNIVPAELCKFADAVDRKGVPKERKRKPKGRRGKKKYYNQSGYDY